MIIRLLCFLLVLSTFFTVSGQTITLGFNPDEYCELAGLSARQGDAPWTNVKTPMPAGYELKYRSTPKELDNRWDLWQAPGKPSVISIRGTTGAQKSWVENAYAAMVPAMGSIKLNDSTTFTYQFAADSNAAVHTGWTIGLGTMWKDLLSHINDLYANGERNILIMGHSQGGAIAYLLHSQLYYMQQNGNLPADLVFKTYCSAPPKPGNLYYAYDFDFITRKGTAFRVINALDWVGEAPVSIQTVGDFNKLNPLSDMKPNIKKMKPMQRMAIKYVSGQLIGSTNKANKTFRKYMGRRAYPFVKNSMPQLQEPKYTGTLNYSTAGIPIVLQPTQAYWEMVGHDTNNKFLHHMLYPYYFLVKEHYQEH